MEPLSSRSPLALGPPKGGLSSSSSSFSSSSSTHHHSSSRASPMQQSFQKRAAEQLRQQSTPHSPSPTSPSSPSSSSSSSPPSHTTPPPPEVVSTDTGTQLKMGGRVKEGLEKYMEAIRINPMYAPAYYNIAVVYSERREFTEALRFYELAVERNPRYLEAYCNIGVIYKNGGYLERAIHYYEKALEIDPNFWIARRNLAIALTDLGTGVKRGGDRKGGVRLYKRAVGVDVGYADAYYNLGVVYGEMGRLERAGWYYELAVMANPSCCEAYNNLGVIMKDMNNLPRAIECYKTALQINPKFSRALNNLAVVYTIQGKLEEAFHNVKLSLSLDPNYAEAYNNLGVLYRDEGRIDRAILCYEQCIRLNPLAHDAGQNRLLGLNYLPNKSVEEISEAHRTWGKMFSANIKKYTTWEGPPQNGERKIKIGYLSADLFTHSVSYFSDVLLRHPDKSSFDIFVYSNVAKEDKKTVEFRELLAGKGGAGRWREVYGKGGGEVAEMIWKDGIDILVELGGHTAGNRMDVVIRKPAPIQISMIGYPNTSGAQEVDFRITDSVADPLEWGEGGEGGGRYVEKLVRLSRCFLCYTPPREGGGEGRVEERRAPCEVNGYVTFGSFNNLAKVNGEVLEVWAEVLKRVPESRFVMKCKPFVNKKSREKILQDFEKLGIPSSRITLMKLLPSTLDHLSSYNCMDIALDCWPYAGTTTTCESLYMGVPVVTLRGPTHAQNVGASILTSIGHPELIANSVKEYVEIAVKLAQGEGGVEGGRGGGLGGLRRRMRGDMERSELMDGEGYMKEMEGRYVEMVRGYGGGGVGGGRGGEERSVVR